MTTVVNMPPSTSSTSPEDPQGESFKGSDLPPVVTNEPPHVLISGAGLAGLFLANILEKANIPYQIFERAKEVLPLGSVLSLTWNILPAFEQLGLYEDLLKISYPCFNSQFYTADLKKIGGHSSAGEKEITGYDRVLFARPELYNLLLSRIPAHKIHFSKKVMSFLQNHEGVMVRLQDGTTYHGDILVGADGAHSGIRQHLYKELGDSGKLPHTDKRKMLKGYICLVGTTDSLDPIKYPGVDAPQDATLMIGDSNTPYAWSLCIVPGNKICWNVIVQLDVDASEDEQFRNSDWSSTDNEQMIKNIYDFRTSYGKLGTLIDFTPKDRISRVFLEDILYETWHHGRTVLIGDAAHKLLPSSGQGAMNALQDAVVLANAIYELRPLSYDGIQASLKDYRDQRYPHVKAQYQGSQFSAKIRYGHTWFERVLRYLVFNWLPKSTLKNQLVRDSQYRPQVSFLPPAPNRGTGSVLPQTPSKRYMEEQAARTSDAVVV